MKIFPLKVISPEGLQLDLSAIKIVLPTKDGQITVLADHSPLVSVLATGKVDIEAQGKLKSLEIHGGTVEVRPHNEGVVLLVDELIDLEKYSNQNLEVEIEKARLKAKEVMESDLEQFAVFEGDLEKYLYLNKILKGK